MQNSKNQNRKSGRALLGLLLLLIGGILLLRSLDIFYFPGWLFSGPVIFIIIGLFIGSRHQFRHPASFILIFVGTLLLANRIVPNWDMDRFFWPIIIIGAGLWIILKPGRNHRGGKMNRWADWDKRVDAQPEDTAGFNAEQTTYPNSSAEDFLDSTSIFGGVKKTIVSKNFKGGDVVNIMGGAEINLMQADIQGRIVLEVTQIFGGTKIILPANWAIHSEMVAIFGGIEDKRMQQVNTTGDKVIIIKGTSLFGGIDIRSF